jgi:hypothetical protein
MLAIVVLSLSSCGAPVPSTPERSPDPAPTASVRVTAAPSQEVETTSAEVLAIGFEYPADWQLHEGGGFPHAWTPFVLSNAASLNCTHEDLGECEPSLDPGGVLVWWVYIVPCGACSLDEGEPITVDGRVARLVFAAGMCDHITQTGGGVPRHEVDRSVGVSISDPPEWHSIHGCFRDPGAAENYHLFLEFLDSVDLPDR